MARIFRSVSTYIAVLAGIAGVVVILFAWNLPPFASAVQVTNDAYVRGKVTTLSPQLAGILAEVPVQDYQHVEQGTLIARLDDAIFRRKLEQAEAGLATQHAALDNFEEQKRAAEARVAAAEAGEASASAAFETAEATWRRISPLAAKGFAPGSDLDVARRTRAEAEAALHQATAQRNVAEQELASTLNSRQSLEAAVANAQAAVELARIDLDHTRILAPVSGRLGEVGGRTGQYVQPGTQLASIVPDDRWIVANYKETQLAGMQPGQAVSFTVDALPGAAFQGHLERFAPATGSEFAVLKSDNATGNFTKIAQRVPVRIAIDGDAATFERLVPGMSVVVELDTAQAATDMRTAAN